MKKSKILSIVLSAALLVSLLAGCSTKSSNTGNSNTTTSAKGSETVKITFLNSKGEIQTQLEDAAKAFTKENPNITVEVLPAPAGQSPFEKVMAMYSAGNAPTLAMLDPGDIAKFKDKFLDLSGEKWVADAIDWTLSVARVDGKVIAFPLAVEGYGFIYNKAVLDKAFGGNFDPKSIRTRNDLENAFKKVEASGVKALEISPMDWSLGAHFLTIAYADQSKDPAQVDKFLADMKAGKVDLANNKVFNGLMDTFDMMKKYNIDKNDPLSPTYDRGPELIGKGEVGFWFMGNWAWPQIKTFDTNGQYGFIPVPISNNPGDYGNSQIAVGPSKFIGIDKTQNNAAQQDAAKKFLNWLVYSQAGQDALVNKANVIPAFKNITLEPQDPLAKSIKQYMEEGNTLKLEFNTILPSDHWSKLGASMQKYLAGKIDRKGLIGEITDYWKNVK
ncbi:carbohydrate ABC transporter substrate-binding protein, CUT1 family [Caldanaerobius fijiensis DSM 17918]|uniref:Carbohydrate ABC transporter substrate-binding protein, CUT1 family n=1 Tax=Caldanaerobius fijiensis DSM 17918 TaxID=1121256 RepID=A0A1M5AHF7_9THEO|nr:ABC transporter substrate-binding protein [Caldanaerobius fijiensis]SHF29653.1 carbohydrate ABC transporter substrate-binding protein, CUT1 family [Caldanaerobius fijiensis DSM 17918]